MSETDMKPTKESGDLPNKLRTSKNVTVAFKLNGTNYPLWARLIKVVIGSRGAHRHITGVPEPPNPGDEEYVEWEETDLIVFSWIVDNIETDLIADFAHHQTSKAIWDSLAVTFESSADPYLVYDLEEKANTIKQGDLSLETYYQNLHGLWINIDKCQARPINCCDKGIRQFRQHSAMKRLFKFLAGLNVRYDSICRDVLKESPLPSVEAAYDWVKREATRLKIMSSASSSPVVATTGEADSSSGGDRIRFRGERLPLEPANWMRKSTTLTRRRPIRIQTRQKQALVLALWYAEAHKRHLLPTQGVPGVVGRKTEDEGEIGRRRRRRRTSRSRGNG